MLNSILEMTHDIDIETRCPKCKVKDSLFGLSDFCENCGQVIPKSYNSSVTIFALNILVQFIHELDEISPSDYKALLVRQALDILTYFDKHKIVKEEKLLQIKGLIVDSKAFGNKELGLLYITEIGKENIYIDPESDLDQVESIGFIIAALMYLSNYGQQIEKRKSIFERIIFFFKRMFPKSEIKNSNQVLDKTFDQILKIIFPDGAKQIEAETLELSHSLKDKIKINELGQIYLHAISLTHISNDKSEERVIKSIMTKYHGIISESDAKQVYYFIMKRLTKDSLGKN